MPRAKQSSCPTPLTANANRNTSKGEHIEFAAPADALHLVNASRRKSGGKMKNAKLRQLAVCGLVLLGAAVIVPLTQANPPIAGARYTGTTSQGFSIVLVVNAAGNALVAGSYVDFQCGDNQPTRHYLDGTPIHIPSGVTNRIGYGREECRWVDRARLWGRYGQLAIVRPVLHPSCSTSWRRPAELPDGPTSPRHAAAAVHAAPGRESDRGLLRAEQHGPAGRGGLLFVPRDLERHHDSARVRSLGRGAATSIAVP